ncbi:MAG: OmpA family protein [Deltaproteobacteria bacterium]
MRNAIVASVALCLAGSALGQSAPPPGFDLERLTLNPSALGTLVVGSGQMLVAGSYRASAALGLEDAPLVLEQGGRSSAVIGARLTLDVFGEYALSDRVEVGASVPIVPYQGTGALSGLGYGAPAQTALETPELHVRAGLLSEADGKPLDLAGELGVGLPLGATSAFAGNPGFSLLPSVMAGHRFGSIQGAAQLAADIQPATSIGSQRLGSDLTLGVGASTLGPKLRGELNAIGTLPVTGLPPGLELLAGARYPLPYGLEAFGLAGPGFGALPGIPAFRALLGLSFTGLPGARPTAAGGPARAPEPAGAALDSDGDGVPDEIDNCPHEPGPASNHGCPTEDVQLVSLTPKSVDAIEDRIFFETGNAKILPRSHRLLNQVAQVLEKHPEIALVRIEGYTDDRGPEPVNRKLSQARAESVRDYLVGRGIAAARLEPHGYGPDRPIATNATDQGRARNRRVDFVIVRAAAPKPPAAPAPGKPPGKP